MNKLINFMFSRVLGSKTKLSIRICILDFSYCFHFAENFFDLIVQMIQFSYIQRKTGSIPMRTYSLFISKMNFNTIHEKYKILFLMYQSVVFLIFIKKSAVNNHHHIIIDIFSVVLIH